MFQSKGEHKLPYADACGGSGDDEAGKPSERDNAGQLPWRLL